MKAGFVFLYIFLPSVFLGLSSCSGHVERSEESEAALRALAREKRQSWLDEINRTVLVSVVKSKRLRDTSLIDVTYEIANAGNRVICHAEISVVTLWHKDQVRGGDIHFNQCLSPGESLQAVGRVRGYTVSSHSIKDVTYIDDCRRQDNWDVLHVDRECALTHGYRYHL